MHIHLPITVVGCLAAYLATSEFTEAIARSSGGTGYQRRLVEKTEQSAADELIRQAIRAGIAPPAHEKYQLGHLPSLYEDELWGMYQGSSLPYRFRRMWVDPVTKNPYYLTSTMGSIYREPFYYVTHNRNFRCVASGIYATQYDYNVRARVFFWLTNQVTVVDEAHAVVNHPVQYCFEQLLTSENCANVMTPFYVEEIGSGTIKRGSQIERAPWLPNVDVIGVAVWYDGNY